MSCYDDVSILQIHHGQRKHRPFCTFWMLSFLSHRRRWSKSNPRHCSACGGRGFWNTTGFVSNPAVLSSMSPSRTHTPTRCPEIGILLVSSNPPGIQCSDLHCSRYSTLVVIAMGPGDEQLVADSDSFRPAPYGQACGGCARAKTKCFYRPGGTVCER